MTESPVSLINWPRQDPKLRAISRALILVAVLCAAGTGQAQQAQQPLAQDEQLYQEATKLLQQKRYSEAIEKMKQAYYLSHAPRLLDNIAYLYAELAKGQSSQSSAARNATEGLGYGRLYLQQENDTFNCGILDAIKTLQQLAHPPPQTAAATDSDDATAATIREFESAYPQNPNPDLRYCVAAAYKERGLDPSRRPADRLPDVELALRAYKDYETACKNAAASYTPRDCSGDIQALQRTEQELRTELGRKIPLHQRTWFRAVIGTLVVGAAAGIAIGVAYGVTRNTLIVPTSAWVPSSQFPAN